MGGQRSTDISSWFLTASWLNSLSPVKLIDQNPGYTEEELKEFEQKLAEKYRNVDRKVEEQQQQRDLKEEISLQVHHRSSCSRAQ